MKISIVIPNYNGRDLLEKNLPEILAATPNCEIIIVDDASTDGSPEMLKDKFPQVKVLERKTNGGFSASINDGVESSSGDLLFLLNSDAIPQKNTIKFLLPHFQNLKVFAVGCLEKKRNGENSATQGRGIGKFAKGFLIHAAGNDEKTNTLWVFGGAGIYRKEVWKKLGGMETLYSPFYWEDIDISYRAVKSGYELIFEPKSIVYHDQEKGAIRSHYSTSHIKTIAYRNQILFVWLNITDLNLILSHLIWLPIHLIQSLISRDSSFIYGFWKALLLLPKVIMTRHNHTKTFLIKDQEILASYAKEF